MNNETFSKETIEEAFKNLKEMVPFNVSNNPQLKVIKVVLENNNIVGLITDGINVVKTTLFVGDK